MPCGWIDSSCCAISFATSFAWPSYLIVVMHTLNGAIAAGQMMPFSSCPWRSAVPASIAPARMRLTPMP